MNLRKGAKFNKLRKETCKNLECKERRLKNFQKKESANEADARKQAMGFLVAGVILQPSGVFAALHAQDVGCKYLRAS